MFCFRNICCCVGLVDDLCIASTFMLYCCSVLFIVFSLGFLGLSGLLNEIIFVYVCGVGVFCGWCCVCELGLVG